MAAEIVLSCVLILASSVQSLTDPTLPDIFFPFGSDVGDAVVPVEDEGSSPGLHIPEGFPFFSSNSNIVYVSWHRRFCSHVTVNEQVATVTVATARIAVAHVFVMGHVCVLIFFTVFLCTVICSSQEMVIFVTRCVGPHQYVWAISRYAPKNFPFP